MRVNSGKHMQRSVTIGKNHKLWVNIGKHARVNSGKRRKIRICSCKQLNTSKHR